ncbi:MAG TPA: hypothetical protein PK112_01590, partial [candidate division Zixibacteria bacterium]|nr:hypothetical protein [candidate division Zixibacteria bacterium]
GIGRCVGGMFAAADGANTFGVDASATSANADSTCAVRGYAKNSATGGTSDAIGGVFIADSAGTAWKWGSIGLAYGGSREATGVYGWAETNATVSGATGVFGQASNTGPGDTQGGYFWGHGESGDTYGAKTFGYSTTGSVSGLYAHGSVTDNVYPVYGVYGRVDNYSSGSFNSEAYAGYFENCVYNASNAYGLYGHVYDVQGIYACYGVVGRTAHTGSGSSIAGSFETDSTGTGTAYGVRASGLSKGSAPAYGVYGSVASRGNGNLYAGYFKVSDYGTGLRYGVYASSSVSGYAGYFSGDVRVTGDQVVVGSKSAAVEVEPEDYRLVYSQESPECWFEDFGEGQLVNGRTHVELDPVFLRTVTVSAQHPMKVFIQLNDPDCNGTAVVRGMTGFDVIELQNGQGSASFTYRVVAKRKGYEDVRLAQMPGQTPEEVEAEAKQAEARLQTEEEQAAQREIAERDRLAQIRQEERERQEARPFGDRD